MYYVFCETGVCCFVGCCLLVLARCAAALLVMFGCLLVRFSVGMVGR